MTDGQETYNYTFYMIHRKGRNIIDIYDEEDGEHYIGSTRQFKIRCSKHTGSCNNINNKDYNQPVYQHLRLNGGFDEWEISVIETHDNLTKKEALIHERWLQELYGSNLNKCRPIVLPEERHEIGKIKYRENIEYEKERKKKWRENNPEKVKEKTYKDYHDNLERESTRKKKFYLENKDMIKVRQDKYREENKDAINERNRAKNKTPKYQEYHKNYREKNKEKRREYDRNRQATRTQEQQEAYIEYHRNRNALKKLEKKGRPSGRTSQSGITIT